MSKLKQLLFSLNENDRKVIEEKLKEKDQQIDQLKQQNEELMLQLSKYEIEKHKPTYCTLAGTECEYLGNVDELKQQLAEKDKEIAILKAEIIQECKEHQDIMQQFKQVEKQFAIQELEKVKSFYTTSIYDRENAHTEVRVLLQRIDQQIKELKGEKDE